MKIRQIHTCSILIFSSLLPVLLPSCANVQAPSGGPKDITPPRVIRSTPSSMETNMDRNKIDVYFDEFIRLFSPEKEIIISPKPSEQPKFHSSKKHLSIQFHKPLLENTTYTINFGASIRDLNEGNTLQGYSLVFSTGTSIDSLQIAGKINYPFPVDFSSVRVMLYNGSEDSLVLKSMPSYVTYPDKNGRFRFSYLPEKPFTLIALEDKNANYHADPGELLGFIPGHILPSNDSSQQNIQLYEPARQSYVTGKGVTKSGVCWIHLNTSSCPVPVIISGSDTLNVFPNKQNDSMFFLPDTFSLPVYVHLGSRTDTLKFTPPENKKNDTSFFHQKDSIFLKMPGPIGIQLKYAVKQFFPNKIHILSGHDTVIAPSSFIRPDKPLIEYPFKPGESCELIFEDHTFEAWDRTISGRKKIIVSVPENSFSKLEIDFPPGYLDGAYIFRLYNENSKQPLYERAITDNSLLFNYLLPGKYLALVYRDINGNTCWDPGNFETHQLPEPFIAYPGTIEVKPNWDQVITFPAP